MAVLLNHESYFKNKEIVLPIDVEEWVSPFLTKYLQ